MSYASLTLADIVTTVWTERLQGFAASARRARASGWLAASAALFSMSCLDMLGDVNVDRGVGSVVQSNTALDGDCSDAGVAAGECVVRCEPEMPRCANNLLQRCNALGNGWDLVDQCASRELCDAEQVQCLPPACAARQHRCTESGELQVCKADRSDFERLDQCRSAAFCSAVPGREGCEGTACRAGRQRCNGAQIEQCRADRSGFDTVGEPCASAALCKEGESELARCEAPTCQAGVFACDGAVLSRCSDDSTTFIVIDRCGPDEFCLADQQRCGAGSCVAGTQRCDGDRLERCNTGGTAYDLIATCASPLRCDAAAPACLDAVSPPPDPTVLDGADYSFEELTIAAVVGLGPLTVSVPEQWTDIDRSPWTNSAAEPIGPRVIASRDAARFARSFDIPGVSFAATAAAPVDVAQRLLEIDLSAQCTRGDQVDYEDPLYAGRRQTWTNCGATNATTTVVVAAPSDAAFVAVVIVTMTAERDQAARTAILDSFQVE